MDTYTRMTIQKLLDIVENYQGDQSFEEIIMLYIDKHYKNFPAHRVHSIIVSLNELLYFCINRLEMCEATAKERAIYLKSYLKGEMYTSKEAAEKHVDLQIDHAQTIIDSCSYIDPSMEIKDEYKYTGAIKSTSDKLIYAKPIKED